MGEVLVGDRWHLQRMPGMPGSREQWAQALSRLSPILHSVGLQPLEWLLLVFTVALPTSVN